MRSILLLLFILGLSSFTAEAQLQLFGNKWQPGCYYDLNGNRVEGLIKHHDGEKSIFKSHGDYIAFKKTKDDKKVTISSDSIKAFVAGQDSFVVSHFDDLKKIPFLQVVVSHNDLKLYLSVEDMYNSSYGAPGMGFTGGYTYTKDRYYYGTDPDNIVKLDRKSYIEVMSKVMADNPEVVKSIQDKSYRYGDIDDLITYYNTGKDTHTNYWNSDDNQ